LNWPFREPLVTARDGRVENAPIRVDNPRLAPSNTLARALAEDLAATERGLIVVGPQDDPHLPEAVSRVGYPVLADALSGVRRGRHDRRLVIDTYDAFLRDAATVERLEPEVVVRIGAIPTSKPLQQYLQRHASARHVLIDPGGWRDPFGLATDVVHVDPRLLLDGLVQRRSDRWTGEWTGLNAVTRRALEEHLRQVDELFEGKVFSELSELLPEGAVLVAGNSMPVRDLDTFLPQSCRGLRCLSNRGANGIDGVVSTALGASAADIGPAVLAIGDISFYHDLNGLLAARTYGLDLLVVLLNNDGGGIFSFLPQAEAEPARFEQLFGTPHGLDFRPFVEGYGGHFVRVCDWSSFGAAVNAALSRGGLNVVEVPTERRRNVAQHRAVWRSVANALAHVAVC
jgi:2-succinyl-5-enolpyruvyl-6-hydroxy-3-cyclohexene-1-carboxylate synthase